MKDKETIGTVELIDKNKLKEELDAWAYRINSANPPYHSGNYGRDETIIVINAQEVVSAVPVIRCKECDFGHESVMEGKLIRCVTGRHHDPEWFCADGARREN